MRRIAASGDFLRLRDLYHSPGYQLLLGAVDAAAGEPLVFRVVKLLAWTLAALCAAMTWSLGERLFGRGVGALAAVLLCFSAPWIAYVNLLQYEVPLAFLLTALAWLLAVALPDAPRPEPLAALAGLVLAAACFLHFRVLLLAPLAAASLWARLPWRPRAAARARRAALALLLAPAVLSVGAWSVCQTRRLGELCVVQKASLWDEQFRLHNHAAAPGWAFPYVEPVGPAGLAFVARRPGRYLWLVKERFLYIWDLRKDVWYVGPSAGAAEWAWHLAACLLFCAGLALKLRDDRAAGGAARTAIVYSVVLAGLAGPLLSTGSSRFLVPLLPLVGLFQAYAAARLTALV